jgi:Holliday junction resolvase
MTGGAAPYRAGTLFERQVQAHLARNGYFVIRAAGSHGVADIVALKHGQTLLVQCKRAQMRGREWNALLEIAAQCDALPILAERAPRRMPRADPLYTLLLRPHVPSSSVWPGRPFAVDFA